MGGNIAWGGGGGHSNGRENGNMAFRGGGGGTDIAPGRNEWVGT